VAKEWTACPKCGVSVKKKNLQRHLGGIHKASAKRESTRREASPRPTRGALVFPVLIIVVLVMASALAFIAFSPQSPPSGGNTVNEGGTETVAVVRTSMGTFEILLYTDEAPLTTTNFINLAERGFYDGLLFHRVIDGFMIQGGGFEPGMVPKSTFFDPIPLETTAGLKNERGTVAMARTPDPDSATTEFFVNLVDNPSLDPTTNPPGYAVFGRVIKGMEVVDAIGKVPTTTVGTHENVPVDDVLIYSIVIEVR
jgi:cyclophilin family peptidyl-prolyl cis-trans isomerase